MRVQTSFIKYSPETPHQGRRALKAATEEMGAMAEPGITAQTATSIIRVDLAD